MYPSAARRVDLAPLRRRLLPILCVVWLSAWPGAGPRRVEACPFCSATSKTLSEEIATSRVVLLAKLLETRPASDEQSDEFGGLGEFDADSGKAKFAIVEFVKGDDELAGLHEIEVIYFGAEGDDRLFLVTGVGDEPIIWTTPLPLTNAAVEYIRRIQLLPDEGVERLDFFQGFLEHEDPLLAQDAYDEFARAPYDVVQALRERMDHDQLVAWIKDPQIGPTRRRLYLTMLGVCGNDGDIPLLESFIRSDYRDLQPAVAASLTAGHAVGMSNGLWFLDELLKMDERRKKQGLDALIACYLTLKGAAGLPLIEQRFLTNRSAEYSYIYSAIMALRFHGESTDVLPRDALLASMRLLLDNPDFADQVVHDLSRWEDWSVLDRLVEMFKTAEEDSFIRQPVIAYLTVCSEQDNEISARAAAALRELEELDPETVERAKSLMSFGFLARARAGSGEPAEPQPDAPEGDAADEDLEPKVGDDDAVGAAPDESASRDVRPTTRLPAAEVAAETVAHKDNEGDHLPAESPQSAGDTMASASASTPGGQPATMPVAEVVSELEPPSRLGLLGVPLLASFLLTGLFWLILRGTGGT